MVQQRQESAKFYEESGQIELAESEKDEMTIIQEFLPKYLNNAEIEQAIDAAISKTGAKSLHDMGRVIALLKENYAGQLIFQKLVRF